MNKSNDPGDGTKKKNYRARKDFQRRIIFGIVAGVLSLGLLVSSIAWIPGINNMDNNSVQETPAEPTADELEAQIKAQPNDVNLLDQLGQAYLRENNSSKAVETYQKAVKLAPGRDDLENRLAEAYVVVGQYDEAIKILEGILSRNPSDKKAHYNYGHALVGKQEYRKAQGEFEQYIQLNGENNPGTEEAKRLVETLKEL